MAETPQSTATLRLKVGDLTVVHEVRAPAAAVRAIDVVPALQRLVNAVVDAAEHKDVAAGHAVSCRKGCGACCRQLVPVSRTEGEHLLALLKQMPPARRERLRQRFAAAEQAIERAGLKDRGGRSDRELSVAYFAMRVPCPFLEEESCSIHPDRPLVCREYLVTSPAELCAGPAQEGVAPVAVPKVSMAARKLEDDADDWFPLALLMAWARTRPKDRRKRLGMEWIQRFVQRMSGR